MEHPERLFRVHQWCRGHHDQSFSKERARSTLLMKYAYYVLPLAAVCIIAGAIVFNREESFVDRKEDSKSENINKTLGPKPEANIQIISKGPEENRVALSDKKKLRENFEKADSSISRKQAFSDLLPFLSNSEAVAALELFPIGEQYDWAITEVVTKVVHSDIQFAENWLINLPSDASNYSAYSAFGKEYAKLDLKRSTAFADKIADPAKRMNFASQVISAYGTLDPKGAIDWIHNNPQLFLSMNTAYQRLFMSVPLAFAIENIDFITSEAIKTQTLKLITKTALPVPPDPLSQPNGESTSRSIESVNFNALLEKDAISASQYLQEMPASQQKDKFVENFIQTIKNRQPREAFTWALNIQDENVKIKTLYEIAALRTGENLEDLIEDSSLDEKTKLDLQKVHK